MNIKVCGITQLKQLQQLDKLGIDFAGLIFHQASPRFVGDKLNPAEVRAEDFDLKKVGVFVNESYDNILQAVKSYGLDVVQLHGDESPELCDQLLAKVEVIKVFHIGKATVEIDELLAEYDEVCDYYLFDTALPDGTKGGTGKKFDWKVLSKADVEKPFFVSGGIGLEDATKLKKIKHPDFYGVDINSRFEKEPGVKDLVQVLQFKQALK